MDKKNLTEHLKPMASFFIRNRGKIVERGMSVLFILILVILGFVLYSGFRSGSVADIVLMPPSKPVIDPYELERQIHDLINEERNKTGWSSLKWSHDLANVARRHSQYLAELNEGIKLDIYIDHEDQDGEYHDDRLKNYGVFYFNMSAENIYGISIVKSFYIGSENTPAEYYTLKEIANKSVEGWMNSPGHRENILTQEFDETGIGVATDPNRTNYIITQVFIDGVTCGYKFGPCCEKPFYYPYCFVPLNCTKGICVES